MAKNTQPAEESKSNVEATSAMSLFVLAKDRPTAEKYG